MNLYTYIHTCTNNKRQYIVLHWTHQRFLRESRENKASKDMFEKEEECSQITHVLFTHNCTYIHIWTITIIEELCIALFGHFFPPSKIVGSVLLFSELNLLVLLHSFLTFKRCWQLYQLIRKSVNNFEKKITANRLYVHTITQLNTATSKDVRAHFGLLLFTELSQCPSHDL